MASDKWKLGKIASIVTRSMRSGKFLVHVRFYDAIGKTRIKTFQCSDKIHAEYVVNRINRHNS